MESTVKLDFSEAVEILPPFNVIVFHDDHHSHEYMMDLMMTVFSHNENTAKLLVKEIKDKSKAVAYTTHREKAELKAEQAINFGGDEETGSVKPVKVAIEPA